MGDELSRGQARDWRTDGRTDGRTDTYTHRQTQATTIPEGQKMASGKNDMIQDTGGLVLE